MKINIKHVVMIKGDEKNHGKWKNQIIDNISMGKDKTIRSIRIHAGKNIIERPIQLLCTIELHCHWKTITSVIQDDKTLKVHAAEFRRKRSAVAAAEQKLKCIADIENHQ